MAMQYALLLILFTVSYKVHGDFGNTLTIEWRNVTVAEPYEHPLGGKFTFQVMS